MNKITAIITVHKRVSSISKICDAVINQSIPPSEIILLHNIHPEYLLIHYPPKVKTIISEKNFNCYFRWSIIPMLDADFVAIIDDDILLGKRWFETCLDLHSQIGPNAAFAGVGINNIKFKKDSIGTVCDKYGWISAQKGNRHGIKEVILCQPPIFTPIHLVSGFWNKRPYSLNAADDYHFSDTVKRNGGKIIVTPHNTDKGCWSNIIESPIDYDDQGRVLAKSLGTEFNVEKDEVSKKYLKDWGIEIVSV